MVNLARKGELRVGIREVAEQAQVSIATVSQVLNGKGSFSPRTRERVLAAATELGYRPNPTAAALGAGRASGRLGVLGLAISYAVPINFSLTDSDYFTRLIAGATQAALARDYALVVGPPTPQTRVWLGLPMDGVIVVDPVVGDEVPGELRTRRTPLVIVGRDPGGANDVRVSNDPDATVRIALDHLAEGGCRRPALFGYPLPDAWVGGVREAFQTWCEDKGLPPRVMMLDWELDDEVDGWLAAALVGPDAVDGVLCLEDDLATTLEAVAREHGVRIPDDLQVVALSDRPSFPGIAFTTVELDPAGTGRSAVNTLIDLVEGGHPPSLTDVPTKLVPRDSTRSGEARRS